MEGMEKTASERYVDQLIERSKHQGEDAPFDSASFWGKFELSLKETRNDPDCPEKIVYVFELKMTMYKANTKEEADHWIRMIKLTKQTSEFPTSKYIEETSFTEESFTKRAYRYHIKVDFPFSEVFFKIQEQMNLLIQHAEKSPESEDGIWYSKDDVWHSEFSMSHKEIVSHIARFYHHKKLYETFLEPIVYGGKKKIVVLEG